VQIARQPRPVWSVSHRGGAGVMTASSLSAASSESARWRTVVAASIGNALEWFDFVLYGFFAVTMAKLFFPADDKAMSLLLVFATFGVTFFVRPVGAIVLGSYADRHGRKAAFMLSIGLMTAGTALIAVAPTYATIGVAAPLLMVIARVFQGFSAGGEFGTATALLAEQNPERRGFFASWQFASQALTTILATTFGVVLARTMTPDQLESWGWRVPFFFGLLIGPVAYYIRRHVEETVEFQTMRARKTPLREAISNAKTRMLVSLGLVVLCTGGMYTLLFMPTFATQQLGMETSGAFSATLLASVIQVALIPVVGALSDRCGRLPIAAASAIAIFLTIYPMFAWLAAVPTFQTLLIVQTSFCILLSGYMGGLAVLMSELFPTQIRTTGLAVSYSFSVAIFGGFGPFISAWLIEVTNNTSAPSFYLMFCALISMVGLAAARRLGVR
jgi:MHS family proline/betaine transporter-like MFS transporter